MTRNTTTKPVAVIGIGCLFPKAPGAKEYWRLLSHGEDAVVEVPESHWKTGDFYNKDPKTMDHTYCTRGGYLSPVSFNPAEFGIPPNILEATDSSQLLSLVVAKMALDDAGYGNDREFDRAKVSVMLGATGTQELVIPLGARLGHPKWKKALEDSGLPPEKTREVMERISDSYVPWQENSFPGLLGNVIAGRIANRFDLHGTNTVLDSACASSLSAVNLAFMELQTGRSDVVLTGGVDALNDIFMHMCFAQTGVLSHTGDAKPFSSSADGTVLGEGIGMIVLKQLDLAEQDGDRIYAVLKSVGASSDGKSLSIYAPSDKGQAKAIAMAYSDAGVDPSTVELVEAHGTGTKGDLVEFSGLKEVFKHTPEHKNWCAMGSVKSMIGHTKAAAGAAGIIKGILALHHKVLPPTIKIDAPDPKMNIKDSPFYLNTESRPWFSRTEHPRRCGVTACGFGGSNFHVVLEEYGTKKVQTSWDGSVEILAFSGAGTGDVKSKAETFAKSLTPSTPLSECDARFRFDAMTSRNTFNSSDPFRLLITLNKTDNPAEIIRTALDQIDKNNGKSFQSQGIFFGTGSDEGSLAFIFPGQGSQYTGMGKDLITVFPEAQEIIEKANAAFDGSDARLSDLIFPLPDHITDKKTCEETLRKTNHAQPAIGAVSLAMNRILNRFGIHPEAVCGHSFGELSALCSAGWIDEETFMQLAVARGRLMASCGNDAGTMLAVKAPIDDIESLIRESGIDVVLANRNAYDQGVLSGSNEAIAETEALCKDKGFRTTRLPVAAAFHSSLVKAAAEPFEKELGTVSLSPTEIPVLSNTTGTDYPTDSADIRSILGKQLLNPVNYIDNIETLYSKGIRTFVEVGPKPVLSGLTKAILKDRDATVIALDASSGRKFGVYDLAKTLCHLASTGIDITLSEWEEQCSEPKKQAMSIPVSGVNYRNEVKERPKTTFTIPAAQPAETTDITPSVKPANISARPDIMIPEKQNHSGPKPIQQKPTQPVRNTMKPSHNTNPTVINDALKVVQEGLKSMQAIQAQTANAHNRFLDAQTEAGKTLQAMMEKTQQMASTLVSGVPATTTMAFHTSEAMPVYAEPDMVSEPAYAGYAEAAGSYHAVGTPQTATVSKPPVVSRPEPVSPVKDRAPAPSDGGNTKIEETLLDVVSKLTGYPVEMLGLDMDIEADLGIDSIKRVEILSTFEERMPDLPPVSPDVMSGLKTLGEISNYLDTISGGTPLDSTPSAPAAPAADTTLIRKTLLDVVSELTGYPVEMLGLDMDLEADLGIDSIKRVEILSTFEEKVPDLPAANPERMSAMKTLGEISSYLAELSSGDTSAPANTITTPQPGVDLSEIRAALLDVVSELTGYPVEMLDPEMDIEADLGIDSIKRVEILSAFEEKMPDLPTVDPETMGTLKTLGQISGYISDLVQPAETAPAPSQLSPAASSSPGVSADEIEKTLLDVVSQLTGYPVEMLGLDMDIEADLGIDSIKRVEIMSEFEERLPGIPTADPETMGTLKTLGQISEYITGPVAAEPVQEKAPDTSAIEKEDSLPVSVDRQIVSFSEGAHLSGRTLKIANGRTVYVTDDQTGLGAAIVEELKTSGIDASLISVSDDTPNAGGIIILPDLKRKRSGAWNKKDETFLKDAFLLAKRSAADLHASAAEGGALFATVTRLDGRFGFYGKKIQAPVTGGLAGLAKTASLEWDGVTCKAVDISPGWNDTSAVAGTVIDELLSGTDTEVGLNKSGRSVPCLESADCIEGQLDLKKGDVVVVSGGAKGVTAAAALALSEKINPVIVLLGRSGEPGTEPEWLDGLNAETDIKKAILENEFTGRKVTPVQVDKSFRKYMGNREITETISKLEATGATAVYRSADVRDSDAITAVLEDIRSSYGPVKAFIHGAGVLEDRLITDKTEEQFDAVYSTKVKGLETLLKAMSSDDLKYLVLFSSVSARLGNNGQVDYSIANEVLNKVGRHYAATSPECRVISINWGPWDGGMVNPALKKEFLKKNIYLIPIKEGAECMVREMSGARDNPIEIVVGATLTPAGKKLTEPVSPPARVNGSNLNLTFKKDVDTASYPILTSHIINSKPVVPFALMTEWVGHSALHENPGFALHGIDDMRVLKGIKIENNPKTIRLLSGKASKSGSFFEVDVEIRNGHKGGVDVIHSKAKAILSDSIPEPPVFDVPQEIASGDYSLSMDEAYDSILFHGPELKGIKEVTGCTSGGMIARLASAPEPSEWITDPLRTNWVADPLILDSAYQMAILWCYEEKGVASLPSYSESYRQYAREFPKDGVTAVMTVNEVTDMKMKSDFTFLDNNSNVIATISGYEAVMDESLLDSFKTGNTESGTDTAPVLFDRKKLLAYAIGNPSEAFGPEYKAFDNDRIIARLPGPPYFFMDRVLTADHQQWHLGSGGWIEAEYDIPDDEWYFLANRSDIMPFCVLLEIALQPCGWLAAYAGSALRSDNQLKFRNLGGNAVLHRDARKGDGSLMMRSRMKKVSEAAGIIIEEFDIQVWQGGEIIYEGDTNFGFFTNETMENQVGIRNPDTIIYTPTADEIARGKSHTFINEAPLTPEDTDTIPVSGAAMPSKALLMIDEVDLFVSDGGPHGLGYIRGLKTVDPDEWFFKAHFYQDPVCPGSLGIESFIQLIKYAALDRWGGNAEDYTFEFVTEKEHNWIYRGQVVPRNKTVEVSAIITEILDGDTPVIMADGYLRVDGLLIYQMTQFGLRLTPRH